MSGLGYKLTLDNTDFKKKLAEVRKGILESGAEAERTNQRIMNSIKRAGALIPGVFSVVAARGFAKEIINVRGEMELLEASFETLVGKAEYKQFMRDLKDFAVESPLSLTGVSKAAQTLLGFNVEAEKVLPVLRQLGDISMGNEQRFQSLTLAFAQMSSVGKLMGQDLLQMINAGFNPLQEISRKTGKSISDLRAEMEKGVITSEMVADAFKSATDEGGKFHGMTKKQAEGIKGLQAELQGLIQDTLNKMGSDRQGLITSGYKAAINLVENYERIGKAIAVIVATYGTYKAALIAINVVLKEQAAINAMVAASNGVFNKSLAARWLWTERLQKAQALLNKTMLTNPYVLAAASVAALGATIYLYTQRTTAAEKAQKQHNEELKKAAEAKEALLTKTNSLADAINDETKTIHQQVAAWRELKKEIPEAFQKMTLSEFRDMSVDERKRLINESADTRDKQQFEISLNEAESRVNELRKQIDDAISSPAMVMGSTLHLQEELEKAEEIFRLKQAERREREEIAREAEFEALSDEKKLIQLNQQLEAYKKQYAELEKQVPETMRSADAISHVLQATDDTKASVTSLNVEWGKFDAQTWYNIMQLNALNGNIQRIEATMAGINAATEAGETYAEAKARAEQEYKDATRALEDVKRNADNYTRKQYEDAAKLAAEKKQAYEDLGGVTRLVGGRSVADRARELAAFKNLEEKQGAEMERAVKDIQFSIERSRVEAMEDGADKALAQMRLDHEIELEELDRQREDYLRRKIENARVLFEANPANAGKLFDGSSVGLSETELANFDALQYNLKARQDKDDAAFIERQRETMNKYLAEYGNYLERRQAVIDLYNDKMAKSLTKGDKLILEKEMKKALAAIDDEASEKIPAIAQLFSDMSDKSIEELRRIRYEAEELWDFISTGKWDEDTGALFGITKEVFDSIITDPEKLSKFKRGLDNVKESIYQLDTPIGLINEGFKELFDPKNNGTIKQIEALDKLKKGLNDVSQAVQNFGKYLESISGLVGKDSSIGSDISKLADIGADIGGTVASAMTGDFVNTTKGYFSYWSKIFSWVSENKKHRKELRKEIQENQDREYFGQLEIEEVYRRKYEWAQKTGETTLSYIKREGEELKKQATENEKAQSDLWSKLRNEQYKSGEYFKKTGLFGWGKGKIVEEWTSLAGKTWKEIEALAAQGKLSEDGMKFYEALKKAKEEGEDITKMQEDYLERLKEVYTGSSYDGIVSGIVNAFKQGKRSAKDFADSFEDLMRGAVESSLTLFADQQLQSWYSKYAELAKDGLSKEEIEGLREDYIRINENISQQADQLKQITGIDIAGETGQGPASFGEYEKITQDQASAIDGRLTGIHMIMVENSQTFKSMGASASEIRGLSVLMLEELQGINKNTKLINRTNDILEKININTDRI